MNFLGLIFKCQNGKFVKVEKEGIFELPDGSTREMLAGREITKLGDPKEDYILWTLTGKNLRDPGWNLLQSKPSFDTLARYGGLGEWPKERN